MAGSTSDIARFNNGAGTGVITTAGNWTTEGGTPSTPPAAGEFALADKRVNGDMTSGSLTGLGLIELRDWYGNMGSPGTAVTLSGTTVRVNGAGIYYWLCAATTFDLDNLGGGKMFHTGGTIATMRAGPVTLDEGASGVITNFEGDGTNLNAAAGTAFSTFSLRNGSAVVARDITAGTLSGNASLVVTGATTASGTSIIVGPGCKLNWQAGGTIAALYNYGEFSVDGCPYKFTISALYGPRSAKFQRYNAAGTGATTITADNRWGSEGGGPGGIGA